MPAKRPTITATVPPITPGQRRYILIDSLDGEQEITMPAGWRLERDRRTIFRYRALISSVQTGMDAETVTISLLYDSPTTCEVIPEGNTLPGDTLGL